LDSILGLDLTAGGRPAAAAALAGDLSHHELALLDTDEDILAFTRDYGARLVTIDAPLGLPTGQCCLEDACDCRPEQPGSGRECERALSRLGIGCYYTTKRSIIKAMVYRGLRLQDALRANGCGVLEVYPYASKVRLFGKPLPNKHTPAGKAFMQAGLSRLLGTDIGPLDHDSTDALLCGYTGWLHARGLTEALGSATEGQIHIPAQGILDACSEDWASWRSARFS